ncbi:PadR family transcriptional regulator [Enterococcus sp. LJL128]|uniref:PadR family transcriptional regulator n=1 Tax=Enterococcus sp. LJL51 TaxID=3416656 RepID=UPI003CF1039D
MNKLTEMLKGILEGLVLEIISRKETYGYEITKTLNDLGFTDIVEGTVYTILLRLEKNQLVAIEKKPSEKGPARKFYSLNEKGERELEAFWQRWTFVSEKMAIIKDEMGAKHHG